MKKINVFGEQFYCSMKKTLKIMHFTIILLILSVLHANGSDVYSQKTRLSINFSDAKLVSLDKIEVESDFGYVSKEASGDISMQQKSVTGTITDATSGELMPGVNVLVK